MKNLSSVHPLSHFIPPLKLKRSNISLQTTPHRENNFPIQIQLTTTQITPLQGSSINLIPPPLLNMVFPCFILNKYAPLGLPQPLNGIPQDYIKLLPRFIREDDISTQRNIKNLCAFTKNLNVEHLDVVLRLFVQSLHGEARKQFKPLPIASITTWEEMENYFVHKWGEKRDNGYILTKFNAIKKKPNEDVSEFI